MDQLPGWLAAVMAKERQDHENQTKVDAHRAAVGDHLEAQHQAQRVELAREVALDPCDGANNHQQWATLPRLLRDLDYDVWDQYAVVEPPDPEADYKRFTEVCEAMLYLVGNDEVEGVAGDYFEEEYYYSQYAIRCLDDDGEPTPAWVAWCAVSNVG